MPKRVLSVGQCVPDGSAIGSLLRGRFGVEVQTADDADEALAMLHNGPIDLVLVNRVFDADGGSGLELIKAIKSDSATAKIPTMLVSNYTDAQERAVQAGAEPGFGKTQLGSPEVIDRLAAFLSETPTE